MNYHPHHILENPAVVEKQIFGDVNVDGDGGGGGGCGGGGDCDVDGGWIGEKGVLISSYLFSFLLISFYLFLFLLISS